MNIRTFQRHATAAIAAITISAFFVGAAVGPAAVSGDRVASVAAERSLA